MYDKKRNHKKIKKRRSFRAVFLTALICAAVSVLVIVGALWFVGLRYVSLNTADGTKIKFFGMVDSDGTPMRGNIDRLFDRTYRRRRPRPRHDILFRRLELLGRA